MYPRMKIVLMNSSGRKNGNTDRLLKMLGSQLLHRANEKHLTLEINHVLLSGETVKSCLGCRSCFDRDVCPLKDDVIKIGEGISDADALILASPVYLEDVNGIMKNWLDRMAYNSHRPAYYKKYAVAITTSGAGASNHSLHTMKRALTAWGFHVLFTDKFIMGAYMEDERIESAYISKLSKIAADLIASIQADMAQKPTLLSLISFRIQQKYYRFSKRAGMVDRAYWEKKGWLEPKVNFYTPIRCNPVKLLFARVLGAFLSRLFIRG